MGSHAQQQEGHGLRIVNRNWYNVVKWSSMPKKRISFDFDNTLTQCHTDHRGHVIHYTSEPNWANIQKLKDYAAQGYEVGIVTARSEDYETGGPQNQGGMSVFEFVEEYELPVSFIHFTNGEPKGPHLIDHQIDLHHDDQQHEIDSCNEHGVNVEHVGTYNFRGGLK